MTCKDCKYFNKDKHPKDEYIGYGYCERRVADGYEEYPSPDAEICNMFECVGNALDALDSFWESVSK